ncbi:MAG: aspartate/glutamate racemase family protein [Firmicutes bacterium]|nr:aspartate/glutamate racemase family protein [Bacillota bacterium]
MGRPVSGGYNSYGQNVGIIMLDTKFPRLPGDIGNASTWRYPVMYRTVKGAVTSRIMGHEPDRELIGPFIDAARELEAAGAKIITTSCGFLAPFQRILADEVSVTVATSSLLQVPLVARMIGPRRKVGILTERARFMSDVHFEAVGFTSRTVSVAVGGLREGSEFADTFIGGRLELDYDALERDMIEGTERLVRENPEVGAIVFECTNMVPFSKAVQEAVGLPVFDIVTLVDWCFMASESTSEL